MFLYNVIVVVIIGSPNGAIVLERDFRRTLFHSNFDATLSVSECADTIVDLATNNERRKLTYTCPEPTENLG